MATDQASADPSASYTPFQPTFDASVDACTVLSPADIKSIIGTDPGTGTAPFAGACLYDATQLVLGAFAVDEYDAVVQDARNDPKTTSVDEISGVGDAAAYVTQADSTRNGVVAKQGSVAVAVAGPGSQQELSDLATALLTAIG